MLFPRRAVERVRDALSDTPAVLIHGARQVGKTTLASTIEPGRAAFTLDDASVLAAARADPAGFVAGLPARVFLDEIQRVPDLALALKAAIDRDRRPGRFLLTGSTSVLAVPRLADALAGRMEVCTLWPLAQSEIERRAGPSLDAWLDGEAPETVGEDREATWARLRAGGFPEALARRDERRRARWFEGYVLTVLQREVRDLSAVDDLGALPRLLAALAARSATPFNLAEVAGRVGLPQSTARRYAALLQATFLVGLVPAWSANVARRLARAPKLLVHDSGLLCHLVGASEPFGPAAGTVLESFVGAELLRLADCSEARPALHHFRVHAGPEVDWVLEDARGRVVGVEVKAASTVRAEDLGGLRALAEAAGDRFALGLVLHLGERPVPFGSRLHAVPITALWS